MKTKTINLALQGGGAHGAFGWGVLDYLLEDGRLNFEAVTATSAGAMNAAAVAYGLVKGGNESAREVLENFWREIADIGAFYAPVKSSPMEMMQSMNPFAANWDMGN
ncbi:patatin-like phospholipase family protein, partial [Alphaproteobacteria bacterium]|nr:patatin-like phospholipase family protein [Alphaproteobacteria bacterium]